MCWPLGTQLLMPTEKPLSPVVFLLLVVPLLSQWWDLELAVGWAAWNTCSAFYRL